MLNALVFSLMLLTPQQKTETPLKVQCVVVSIAPEPRLVCNDKDKTELVIPSSEWPEAWYPASVVPAHLAAGFLNQTYNAEIRDGQLYAVETKEPEGLNAGIRSRTLAEQRRWRIPALQQGGVPR